MEPVAIGIDLGATKIAAALVTGKGHILATRQLPTNPQEGQAAVLERIADLANGLSAEAVSGGFDLLGIGIGSPGRVDPQAGVVHNAVNLGWKAVPLASELRSRLRQPLPVWVQKDTNTSVIGEYIFGVAKNNPDFVFLSIGTGLGGGLIAAGQLINGANWNASEIGHIVLDPQGRKCACGLSGCAETFISGQGLVAIFEHQRDGGAFRTSLASAPVEPGDIVKAARSGDALALSALAEMGRHVGVVLAFCAALTNPSLVVIGGGLGLATFDLFVPAARLELQKRVLEASHIDLGILPSQLGSSAVGAAGLAWFQESSRSAI